MVKLIKVFLHKQVRLEIYSYPLVYFLLVTYGSSLSSFAFYRWSFVFCTVFSASLFDIGYSRLLGVHWNLPSFAKSLNFITSNNFWYYNHSVLPPFCKGRAEKFSVLAKRGDLHFFWIFRRVSKKGGVDFFRGGPEDLLKVIFNC